jgi:hypothetical protein
VQDCDETGIDCGGSCSSCDTQAPRYSNNITSPNTGVTYVSGATYKFNATWTDNVGVTQVIFELDGSSNTTVSTSQNNEYYTSKTDLAAGTHIYKWYATDGISWNTTGSIPYVINKISQSASFSLSPSSPVTHPTETNASCIRSSGDSGSTIILYRNGSQIVSGTTSPQSEVTTLIGGIYNYTCIVSSTQNYSEATSASNILNVVPVLADITIFLNSSKVWWNDSVYVSGNKIYSNGTIGSGDSYTFYINGVNQCSGTTNSSGGWSCTFRSPIEIGSFNVNITSPSISVTSSNSTTLQVRSNYGPTPSGTSDRAVYENPFFIQDMNGKLKMVMVRITTWKR